MLKTKSAKFLVLLFSLLIVSCKNFMDSEEPVRQIKEGIAYANATRFAVRIAPEDSAHGVVVSGGLKEGVRVSDKFDLEFSPAADYTFLGWDAVKKDDHSVSYDDCVVFSSPKTYATSVQIVKGNDDIYKGQLQLRPLCRPVEKGTINITSTYGAVSYNSEAEYKEGTLLRLSITPNPGYGFTHWIVSIGEELDTTGEYVKIDNPKNSVTDAIFLRRPENNEVIYIIPVCVDRPSVISNTPRSSDDGVCRDSRIKVTFDSDMDEDSIYLTPPEIIALGQGVTLIPSTVNPGKAYGYYKNGKKYYKNIEIKDRNNGQSLLDYFGEPKFNTPDMLVIPTSDEIDLQMYTEILVIISSNFFTRTEDDYPVSLDGKTIWNYLVNDAKDVEPPKWGPLTVEGIEGVFKTRAGAATGNDTFDWDKITWSQMTGQTDALYYEAITSSANSYKYFVRNNKIKVNAEFTDNGTGPSKIDLDIDRVTNDGYEDVTTKVLPIRVINTKGLFQHTPEGGDPVGIEVDLTDKNGVDLPDGAYRLKFIAEDEAGKTADSKYFYVILDKNNEKIDKPQTSTITATSISFSNISQASSSTYYFYQMKKSGEEQYGTLKRLSSSTETINGLQQATSYDFKFYLCDDFGNRNNVKEFTRNTLPYKPLNVTAAASTTSNKAVTVNWKKASDVHYSGARITAERYSPETGNVNGSHVDDEKSIAAVENQENYSYNYEGLVPGYRYVFKLSSYDSGDEYETNNYSESQTASPENLVLAPDPVSNFTVTDNKNGSVILKWNKPAGYVNGYYYSYKNAATSAWSTPVLVYGTDVTQQTVTLPDGITGKNCVFSLQSVVVNSSNHNTKYAQSVTSPECTFFVPPKNLENFTVTSYTNTSITLSWQLPQTDYDGIKIGYKKNGEANYHFVNNVAKNSTSCTISSLSNSSNYTICYYTYKNNGNTAVNCQSAVITQITRPNEIKNFAATSDNATQIKFTWTKPQGDYSGIKIWTKTTSDAAYTLLTTVSGTTTTEYTWTAGSSASVYDVKAAAYYNTDTNLSTESAIKTSTDVDPVTGLYVYDSYDTGLYIEWTNPTTYYDSLILSYKTGNGTPVTTQLNKKTLTYASISNLTYGTCYDITITTKATKSAAGYNKEHTKGQTITGYTRPYHIPYNSCRVTSKTQNTISLSWEPPSTGGVTGYNIYKDDKTTGEYSIFAVSTTATSADIPVTPGHKYDFDVYAYFNDQTNQSYSSEGVSNIYAKPPVCAFEVNPDDSNPDTKQVASWTWPEAGRSDMWLNLYFGTTNNFASSSCENRGIVESNTPRDTKTGLTRNTKYYWWIVTYVGASKLSSSDSEPAKILNNENATISECKSLKTAPNKPTNFKVEYYDGMGRIKFSWTNPAEGTYDSMKLFINGQSYNCTGTQSGWIDVEAANNIGLYAYNDEGIASSKCSLDVGVSDRNLIINGTKYEYSFLNTANADSQKSVTKRDSYNWSKSQDNPPEIHQSVFHINSPYGSNGSVQIPVYSIGAYEVSNQLYHAVMGSNPSHWRGDDMPVEQVSLYDAILFCNKLSALFGYTPYYKAKINGQWYTGTEANSAWTINSGTPGDFAVNDSDSKGFRLPSKVMWEFAARGGDPSNDSHWKSYYSGAAGGHSNDNAKAEYRNRVANNNGILDLGIPKEVYRTDCFSYNGGHANEHLLGLHDMSGNVWELTDTKEGRYICSMGGCYEDATRCAVDSSFLVDDDDRDKRVGFRLCRNKVYSLPSQQ